VFCFFSLPPDAVDQKQTKKKEGKNGGGARGAGGGGGGRGYQARFRIRLRRIVLVEASEHNKIVSRMEIGTVRLALLP